MSFDVPESTDLVEQFSEFYRTYYNDEIGLLAQHFPNEQRSLHISWRKLNAFSPDIADDYRAQPEQIHPHAEEALRQYDLPADIDLSGAHVRITDLNSETKIRDIRSEHINNLVEVRGIIRKATDVRPKIERAAFECQRCGTMTRIEQHGDDFQEPHQCQGCERQGPFKINFDHSEFIDAQKLRIQESPEGLRGGETPQSIDVRIEDDITGEVTPGNTVSATGVLHLAQKGSNQEKSTMFDIYMDGHTIESEDEQFEDMDITSSDREKIRELASHPQIYEEMVDSIAPSIYGHRMAKLAIILQLFSGVTKHLPDGSRTRGDLHMLLIGDPGTGKSQLLQYIKNIAPRSVYTSGKGSSAAGLTAAAVQDDFGDGQQWSLEAGALVLADQGIAAVDELDKMDESDRSAMHEALEQQTISISKAGINATLKARCSLLGAANPKYGRFDSYEPIGEQIDLAPALISRFDLIFTVKDKPDRESDARLADHILQTNYVGELNTQLQQQGKSATGLSREQIEAEAESVAPTIEAELLRKYIALAQQTCYPSMSDEALERIEDFYVDLRSEGNDEDAPVPVTARKLEALVRLAEASARVRLSDRVEIEDANRVIEIVESCLREVGMDPETGNFDVDIVESGRSKSQRDRARKVSEIIKQLQDEHSDEPGAPKEKVLEKAEESGVDRTKAEHRIEVLREKGEVYSPSQGYLRSV